MLKFFIILSLIALLGFLVYRFLGLHLPSEYPEKAKPHETEYDFFKDTKRNKKTKI